LSARLSVGQGVETTETSTLGQTPINTGASTGLSRLHRWNYHSPEIKDDQATNIKRLSANLWVVERPPVGRTGSRNH